MYKKLIFLCLAILGAVALAIITGIFNPTEKVNALWLILATVCVYTLFYRYYASFLSAKVLALNPELVTPAVRNKDGIDYEPTNKWVLFGHHFAAIAGGGPLIGPILAAQFGYLPGFLWILIGAVLIGAVHDLVILAASVRKNGKSIAQIAKEELGFIGGLTVSLAIIIIIIIALAGLGLAVINALFKNPWGTYTIALTIPIAILMGLYMKFIRPGKVLDISIMGFILLVFAVITGHYITGSFLEPIFNHSKNTLIIILMLYGFAASVLPVWLLLCPRDYLSTYMKIGTVFLLAIGIIVIAPELQMPAMTTFANGGGPIIPGKLFPFMFITIACGAISGFHSLISSGTTPKMITSESHIPAIGYGAMLVEGFVSVMALIAACILIPGDYFAINTTLSIPAIESLGFNVVHINELSKMVGVEVMNRPGGAVSLAVGMASIFSSIPGMKGLMPYWYNFALMFEALFILTTVDAGTRVARFLLQEILGQVYKPLAEHKWLPGIIITSLLVVLSWGYLIYSGNVSSIWPIFGVANQLLAGIALGIGTTYIIKSGKLKYCFVTLIPMIFMYITTLTAAFELVSISLAKMQANDQLGNQIDIIVLCFMSFLAVVSLIVMLFKWYGIVKELRSGSPGLSGGQDEEEAGQEESKAS